MTKPAGEFTCQKYVRTSNTTIFDERLLESLVRIREEMRDIATELAVVSVCSKTERVDSTARIVRSMSSLDDAIAVVGLDEAASAVMCSDRASPGRRHRPDSASPGRKRTDDEVLVRLLRAKKDAWLTNQR